MNKDFERAQKLRNNGKIKEAINLYQKIREINLEKDPDFATECLHLIGISYFQERNYKKAEIIFKKTQEEFEKLASKSSVAKESVGFVLRNRGMNARSSGDLKLAHKFLKASVDHLAKTDNIGHTGISRVKLGRVYGDLGSFNKAYEEINKGIKLLEKSNEKFFLSSSYLDRAKVDVQKSLHILNSFAKKDEFLSRRKDIDNILKNT